MIILPTKDIINEEINQLRESVFGFKKKEKTFVSREYFIFVVFHNRLLTNFITKRKRHLNFHHHRTRQSIKVHQFT